MVRPRPGLGYAMVAIAATLFAVNGTVSKVILGSGISSGQLTAVRCAGALIGLALIAAATRPRSLRVRTRDLPLLIALGIGLAVVQWAYFFAIHRLDIGIALLIQYIAPILVEIWHGGRLSGPGVAACVLAAISYAAYVLIAERGVRRRDPISLSAWGFLFATIFSSLLAPWWNFPGRHVGDHVSLLGNLASTHVPLWLLMLWMVVLGGIVPFALIVSALSHMSATRAGITAMLEPVVAIIVAWAWLGESLRPVQLSGAALSLLGIGLAQTAR